MKQEILIKINVITDPPEFELFFLQSGASPQILLFKRSQNSANFTTKAGNTSKVGCLNFLITFPVGSVTATT